jgi:hypothetical protein
MTLRYNISKNIEGLWEQGAEENDAEMHLMRSFVNLTLHKIKWWLNWAERSGACSICENWENHAECYSESLEVATEEIYAEETRVRLETDIRGEQKRCYIYLFVVYPTTS